MSNQDNLNTNSSCTETEFIEELLAAPGLPWKSKVVADQDEANGEYGICQVIDDVIDIVKLMASCVDETNASKYEVDRLIKEKASLDAQAKQINADKSNVKKVQQAFADEVLLPHLAKLDEILDVAEPEFAGNGVLEAHVQGIRILERAFSNNLISAGLLTQEKEQALEKEDQAQASQELAKEAQDQEAK